jgi:MoxR-like ATPase
MTTEHLLYPYLPDDALVQAVNLAIYLERPLLLKGEPGCGKTRLDRSVAYELVLPYEAWHVKSTSRAQQGF